MQAHQAQCVRDLFVELVALAPEQRSDYVDRMCRDDAGLRGELESLLVHHQAPIGFVETLTPPSSSLTPASQLSSSEDTDAVAAPIGNDRIGRYRLLRQLGEGGMGCVYEAEQDQPRRIVAIKVLRSALAGAGTLRRLAYEAEVLGHLKHPGIAQIYEAGTHGATGGPQPYIAMEYIEGDTLAAFAAAHSMSGRRRLELFCRICDAVQYAHSRGVIHRDLKPANILVDRLGQPRILDFGVARLIDPVVCAIRPQTQAGQVVGTIPYMSPEQAAGRSDLVDCRCDVHALGVILYELMCGQLPYRIEGLSLHEAIRVMQQEDPVPLGRRSGDCRGDVEAICDTAMQRVLARRYASVADLRSDIQRHLEGRPVAARQLTRAEQFMKFARRHRTLVAMAAAVLLTLLLGVAATVHQAVKAQEEARVAQACLRFFREAMTGSSLLSQYGRDATVRERLIAMRDMIPTRFADQPAVCAEVEYILGVACFNVGELEFAEEALRHSLTLRNRLLPADHPDVLSTQFHLASALQGLGRVREAEQIHREVLAIRQRDAAVPSVELALSLNSVGGALFLQDRWEEALRLQRAACEMHRGLDNADPVLAGNASFGLATTLCIMGANEEAMSLLAQAEQMFIDGDAEGSTLHAQLLVRRASSLRALGEDEAAGECFERALRMQRQQSPHSQWTEIALRYYAGHLWARGAYGEAEPMFCEAVAIARDVLPADHPQLADSLNSLGVCLRDMDRLEEAEPLLLEALRIRRLVLGEERLAVSHSLINLAKLRYKAGRWAEAQQDAASALRIRLRHRNELHPEVVEARRVLDALEPDDSLSIAAVEPPAE